MRTRIGIQTAAWLCLAAAAASAQTSFAPAIAEAQPKIVKIYGSGGFAGLEPYQSGFLISADGHVVTVWSYVLDTDEPIVVLDDGRRFTATIQGADPRLEIALLKIEAENLSHFPWPESVSLRPGSRVLAFSNLFGVATGNEPASVQHGSVSIVTTLSARRGVFETPYDGPVYVLDAMTNNPGAAGGALTDLQGRLAGVLGKELRSSLTNGWLNYAVPVESLAETIDRMRSGQFVARPLDDEDEPPQIRDPLSPSALGLLLVPQVVERTPPFIEGVAPGGVAAAADLRPDDLVVFVNDRLVQSTAALVEELSRHSRARPVKITVVRGQELIEAELTAPLEE